MEYKLGPRFGSPTPYDAAEGRRRKKRRYHSRSDQEIEDEMDKRGLDYRAGWPVLHPLPLETVTDGAPELVPDSDSRIRQATTILEDHGIQDATLYFVFRVPRDATGSDDLSSYLTLLCLFDTQKYGQNMHNAVIRMRSALKHHDSTEEVQIELIDNRAVESLSSFPILYNEYDIREKWDKTESVVRELLEQHEWLSLEMLHRGLEDTPDKCPPTIVITSPTARQYKWAEMLIPAILATIAKTAPDFKVEVLLGTSLWCDRKRYKASPTVTSKSYEKVVRMGSSIGISGDDSGCSTLGGSVTLEGGVKCGITNWHCVRDDRLDKVLSKTADGSLRIGNKTLINAPQRILSPSTYDHKGHLHELEKSIHSHKVTLDMGYEGVRELLKAAEKEYTDTQHVNRNLGHVYAGSGRRYVTANRYAIDEKTGKSKEKRKHMEPEYTYPVDWALIRIDNAQQREVVNQIPDIRTAESSLIGRNAYSVRWSAFNVNRVTVPVAKYGRTSGWTFGTINSCLASINPMNDPGISKAYGFTMQKPGHCYTVTNKVINEQFIESGDSGSILVHDATVPVQLGLLFGVTSSGAGMFIPMPIIFQDIYKVTGKQVVEPAYVAPEVVGLASYQMIPED